MELEKSLESYLKTGELIRRDVNFENSPMDTLEKIVIDPLNTIKKMFYLRPPYPIK